MEPPRPPLYAPYVPQASTSSSSGSIAARHPAPADEEETGEPKKKRRALSCTPCRKRKTRCTSGIIPCESCVKRGKADECKWEDGGEVVPMVSYALASDLESLQAQVASLQGLQDQVSALQGLVMSWSGPQQAVLASTSTAVAPRKNSNTSPFLPPSGRSSSAHNSPSGTSGDDRASGIDSTITALERRAHTGSQPAQSTAARSTSEKVSATSALLPSPSGRAMRLPRIVDRNTRHAELLSQVFAALPTDYTISRLVDVYLKGRMAAGFHILHDSTFRAELAEWQSKEVARRLVDTDPAWLAVLFMALSQGVQGLPGFESSLLFPTFDDETLNQLPSAFYHTSLLALEVAEYRARPQMRHVQAVLIMYPFLYHFGLGQEDSIAAAAQLSAAITTAQFLGLDVLTSSMDLPGILLADRAFQGMRPELIFEIAKRNFGWLNCLDGVTANPGFWRLSISSIRPLSTPPPLNLSDADLDRSPMPHPRPSTEMTDATLMICGPAYSSQIRRHMEMARGVEAGADYSDAGFMDRETIASYDLGLRQVLLEMPNPHLMRDREFNWMLCSMWSSIHNRILRAHRPYLTMGYTDPAYGTSRDACIDSARMLLHTQRIVNSAPALRPNFMLRWVLGAALVLTIDLVISIDIRLPAPQIASKRAELRVALDIFCVPNPADRLPEVTSQSRKTIEALLAACDARQRDQAHRPAMSPGSGLGEFFTDVYAKLAAGDDFSSHRRQSSIDSLLLPAPTIDPAAQVNPLSIPPLDTLPPTQMELSLDFINFDFSQLDDLNFGSAPLLQPGPSALPFAPPQLPHQMAWTWDPARQLT